MRLAIDTEEKTLTRDIGGEITEMSLYSKEAFEPISRESVRVGWEQRHPSRSPAGACMLSGEG